MGRTPCCEKEHTNKGAWSREEDERLVNYIKAHGEGNWRSIPKATGLLRCGKSCRFRWINYLRPDLKRGNFTEEEEELIINLHSSLGNKWSQIAFRLPGRTDNDIKNYWNTHVMRKLYNRGIDPKTHQPLERASTSSSVATATPPANTIMPVVFKSNNKTNNASSSNHNNINTDTDYQLFGAHVSNINTNTDSRLFGAYVSNVNTNTDYQLFGACTNSMIIRTNLSACDESNNNNEVTTEEAHPQGLNLELTLGPPSQPQVSSMFPHKLKPQEMYPWLANVNTKDVCLCYGLGLQVNHVCNCKAMFSSTDTTTTPYGIDSNVYRSYGVNNMNI